MRLDPNDSPEQWARNLMEASGDNFAQNRSSGDVVVLANLLAGINEVIETSECADACLECHRNVNLRTPELGLGWCTHCRLKLAMGFVD